jgi:hypothetical protein
VLASVPVGIIAGYYDLTVTNPDGQSDTLTSTYTATNPIPLVTGITPALSVIASTNLAVTISGDNFRNTGAPGVLSASLDGIPLVAVNYVSPTVLTAEVPFALPGVMDLGVYTLTVTNPGPTAPSGSLVNAFTVYTYTTTCQPVPACNPAVGPGPQPDGGPVDLIGTAVITIDFGSNGITNGPGYDLVFYEWPTDIDPGPGVVWGINLDWITIQLVEDGSSIPYTVFGWDNSPGDVVGTNIDSYAAGGESDNEPIPSSDLYPGPPSLAHNSGIAIDIEDVQPLLPPGPFRYVRISVPAVPGDTDGAQIDAVLRLH